MASLALSRQRYEVHLVSLARPLSEEMALTARPAVSRLALRAQPVSKAWARPLSEEMALTARPVVSRLALRAQPASRSRLDVRTLAVWVLPALARSARQGS